LAVDQVVYPDLFITKADLLRASPDARVSVLSELSSHHLRANCHVQRTVTQLTIAAIIGEHLGLRASIAAHFAGVVAEACPGADDLPRLHGFCTSRYFNEFGLVWSLSTAAASCAGIPELVDMQMRILALLLPIARRRGLWGLVEDLFRSGADSWDTVRRIGHTDKSVGYFFVQFPDDRYFVYRSPQTLDLCAFCEMLSRSLPFYSGGLPVVITNDGDHLQPLARDGKYVIRVKKVAPYCPDGKAPGGVTHVFFELPLEGEPPVCLTRTTIFSLPHPFPYMVDRVQVPKDGVSAVVFTPIEKACQCIEAECTQ
jgi:hypothetical protein